jgi:hypothetical protein
MKAVLSVLFFGCFSVSAQAEKAPCVNANVQVTCSVVYASTPQNNGKGTSVIIDQNIEPFGQSMCDAFLGFPLSDGAHLNAVLTDSLNLSVYVAKHPKEGGGTSTVLNQDVKVGDTISKTVTYKNSPVKFTCSIFK